MGEKTPDWIRPNGNGSRNYGGSQGGLSGRSQRGGKSKGCAVLALAMLAVPVGLLAAAEETIRHFVS